MNKCVSDINTKIISKIIKEFTYKPTYKLQLNYNVLKQNFYKYKTYINDLKWDKNCPLVQYLTL
jgi:hypothetical protein